MCRPALIMLFLFAGLNSWGCDSEARPRTEASGSSTSTVRNLVVDASCGQCQLGLPGEGCDLAIVLNGRAYFVDGSHLDDHGDAHGPQGLCNAIRSATVTGNVDGSRFQAERFGIVPLGDS